MAARSKLTVESLTMLGAKWLAEILIAEPGRNRQLAQTVQLALAADTGSTEVGHQVRKRLAQIRRSEALITSEEAKELRTELERLRSAIVETIGAANPKLAGELLFRKNTDGTGRFS